MNELARFVYYFNNHDYRHRTSCFKYNHPTKCRYREPKIPSDLLFMLSVNKSNDVCQLEYLPDIEYPFIYISPYSPDIVAIVQCNTNIQWVYDTRIGFYFSMYSTKNAASAQSKVREMKSQLELFLRKEKARGNENKTEF